MCDSLFADSELHSRPPPATRLSPASIFYVVARAATYRLQRLLDKMERRESAQQEQACLCITLMSTQQNSPGAREIADNLNMHAISIPHG